MIYEVKYIRFIYICVPQVLQQTPPKFILHHCCRYATYWLLHVYVTVRNNKENQQKIACFQSTSCDCDRFDSSPSQTISSWRPFFQFNHGGISTRSYCVVVPATSRSMLG